MTRRLAAVAVLAAVVAAPPPDASAKDGAVAAAWACGPSACVRITGRSAREAITRALETTGGSVAPLEPVQPFYRIRARPGHSGGAVFLLPAAGALQAVHASLRLGPRTAAVLRGRVDGLAPYRPRVVHVWVGARAASHPGAYLGILRGAAARPPARVWSMRMVPVAIELAGLTPWSGWGAAEYVPALRLLHLSDGGWVRVGRAQAQMVAADMQPSSSQAGASSGQAPIAAVTLAAAAAVALAASRRRQRIRAA